MYQCRLKTFGGWTQNLQSFLEKHPQQEKQYMTEHRSRALQFQGRANLRLLC